MRPDYEGLMELLRARRSVRRVREEPLPAGTLERLVEAARWAPSAGNRQPWRVLAVEGAPLRARMGAAVAEVVTALRERARPDLRAELGRYLESFVHFERAPAVLVFLFRPGPDLLARTAGAPARASDLEAVASVSAAIQNLLLAASALGLGACWMTGPLVAAPALRAALEVPEGWDIAALVPVGLPDEEPTAPARRELRRLLQRVG